MTPQERARKLRPIIDLPRRGIGSHYLFHGSFRRRRAMSADDLDTWINYLLEGKQ